MTTHKAMQDINRPQGEWTEVGVEVHDQAQVQGVFVWIEDNAKQGVDVWVHTKQDRPRTWRLGCYNFLDAEPATDDAIIVHPLNIDVGDKLEALFESRDEAVLFKLTV